MHPEQGPRLHIELRSVEAMSVAKLLAVIYLILGVIYAVLINVLGRAFLGRLPAAGGAGGLMAATQLGAMSLLIIPLFGVMGFVGGAIFSWLYNLAARRVGGWLAEVD